MTTFEIALYTSTLFALLTHSIGMLADWLWRTFRAHGVFVFARLETWLRFRYQDMAALYMLAEMERITRE